MALGEVKKAVSSNSLVVFLDFEFYVPLDERGKSRTDFQFNPCRKDSIFLGGSLMRFWPMKNSRLEPMKDFWYWRNGSEKETVRQILAYIEESWQLRRPNEGEHNTPIMFCGFSVSTADLPALFLKSQIHRLADDETLYDALYTAKQIDLSLCGVGFLDRYPVDYIYPKGKHTLAKRFGVPSELERGTSVFDLFERKEYKKIEQRNHDELEQTAEIYRRMRKDLNDKAVSLIATKDGPKRK